MLSERIPFIRPSFPDSSALAEDLERITAANRYSNFGPYEQRFRAEVAQYIGVHPECVTTVNNATSGLMAALAVFLPRGDGTATIAVPSFTFAASAQAIAWHGYRPVWIAVDDTTLQPSIDSFTALLDADPNVRAIVLTQTFGIGIENIDAWEAVASAENLPLIIDSAAGFGSRYPDGSMLGQRGDCEIFSFHATKPFAIGEGGAVVCRETDKALRMQSVTNFGFAGTPGSLGPGINAKMQEIAAAIGLRQLVEFDAHLHERRNIFARYRENLQHLDLRFVPSSEQSSLCFASVILDRPEAPRVAEALQIAGVDAQRLYSPAVHQQPWFAKFHTPVSLSVTESLAERMVSLPILHRMTQSELQRVCDTVITALQR